MSFCQSSGSSSESHDHESARLQELQHRALQLQILQMYGIRETFLDSNFDDIVQLLAKICDAPMAALAFVDEKRLWFKASVGLEGDVEWDDFPFFAYMLDDTMPCGQLFMVANVADDERFVRTNTVLQELSVRSCCGLPLVSSDGFLVGILVVMDVVPRQWSVVQTESIRVFAAQIMAQLASRVMARMADVLEQERDAANLLAQRVADQLALVQHLTHLGKWEYLIDEGWTIWSDEVYSLIGVDAEEMAASLEMVLAMVHPADLASVFAAYDAMVKDGTLPEIVFRIIRPDGEVRSLYVRSESVLNPITGAKIISGTVQDVTEQRRSNQLLENFFDISIDWMCIVDVRGYFMKVNPAFTRSLGYSQAELLSRPFIDFVHADDVEKTLREFHSLLASQPTHGFLNRYRTKDGDYRDIEWIVQPFLEEQLMYAVGRDMTEQMAERRALYESEMRFSRLFSYAAAGITLGQPGGKFIQANPAFCATVGYGEEELYQLDYSSLVYPEDLARIKPMISQLMAGEIDHFVDEHRYITQAGNLVWMRVSLSCIYSEEGRVLYLICVSEDITARVKAQQAVSVLQQQLVTTLENMTDAFCILDLNWCLTYLNKEAERVLLHTREELLGTNLWDRFPPTRNTSLYVEFQRALNDKVAVHFELYFSPLANWFEVHAYPISDGLAVYFEVITTRKESMEALRASEERFNIVARATNDAIWDWNLVDDSLWWNEGFTTLFGYERNQPLDTIQSWKTHIYSEDRARVIDSINSLIHSGREYWSAEYRFVRKDGSIAYVLDRGYIMRDATGKTVRMVGSMVDLTERKVAEDALRESATRLRASEEQYRLLFSHNPHPMWVMDLASLRFMAVNQETVAHYGYSEDEFLSMHYLDLCPEDEHEFVREALASQQFLRNRNIWHHYIKGGETIEVELATDIIQFDGRGAYLVSATDITARRHAEKKVREQAELLDKARDAILVRRLDHTIEYWNHGAELLYGWSAEEVIGRSSRELLYKDVAVFDQAHQQLLEKDELYRESRQVDRFGRELLVESHWTLVRDENGVPVSVLSISTDITERRELEAQFLRVQRMESIGTLAGGIAHDLNNVLAPIILSLSVLKRLSKTPLEQKQLTLLENSAQRGADMVRQVLLFARGVEGERIVVDVRQVVSDLATLIRETFDRRIELQIYIATNIAPVLGDPTQIHQVLLNLCVNARDAMPNGGVLTIDVLMSWIESPISMASVAEPGHFVVLRVSDQGSGIPAAILERIFDPFFTTKGVGKGTGLGLPTVQAVVKSHRGFVNVESHEGQGTTFMIYLPAIERDSVPKTEFPLARPIELKDALILVVDDEDAIRVSTQTALEDVGLRVLTADDGQAALAIFLQRHADIDVVLTDMMMPGMDGVTLIHELRKIKSDVKIIAVTGLASNDIMVDAMRLNVAHFLAKPYSLESLLQILATLHGENGASA